MQLKRVVEMAGMKEHCDYDEQTGVKTRDGSVVRPDMLIRLPGEAIIPVDSKAPLDDLVRAIEATRENDRAAALKAYGGQMRKHIAKVSGDYADLPGSLGFAVMFLPVESLFHAGFESDPGLMEECARSRVILASPLTLMSLLFTVAQGWKQAAISEDAKKIYELGRDLHDRIRTWVSHMAGVGKGLSTAVENYNNAVGSMEGSVLPQARKFAELGASGKDAIAQAQPVDKSVREPKPVQ
jgi:DNA recombination protein RmuC